jgi:murein DD-endopeptidase MepM/ murein hydrolase activator NlpD
MTTPFDGKIGFWHWKGDSVGEATIDQLAQTIRTHASNADAIYVKTNDGTSWQGAFDTKASMAVNSPQDVQKWVTTLSTHGLEFHAWCVVKGVDVQQEAQRIIEVCKVPGVQSMILDVEPYDGYFEGNRNTVVQLMGIIRTALGSNFHLALAMDPRQGHYDSIFPDAWRLYVNSVHPYIYWEEMGRTPVDVLDETYAVWGNYGLPIYPVLQGNAPPETISVAQDTSRSIRGARGISYFRLGVIGPAEFPVINDEVVDQEVGPDGMLRTFGEQIIIRPGEPGFDDGTHTGTPLKQFFGVGGYPIKYKSTTTQADEIWARWRPKLPGPGSYEISVYIPSRHATTKTANYHIHGMAGGGPEVLVKLDQSRYSNQWVPLVIFNFDQTVGSGQVNLTDLTGEIGKEIAFDAMRWRQVLAQEEPEVPVAGPGFDSPIGTAQERAGSKIWPGFWFDATGYGTFYSFVGGSAYHTGADLNLNNPHWDADRDAPVYAPSDGVVTFADSLSVWGQVIIIRHDPLGDGMVVWSRLAHVSNRMVKRGDRVSKGQQLARVGNASGAQPYHLHFDIVKTDVCERNPGHWPGTNRSLVYTHYHDPKQFILDHRS